MSSERHVTCGIPQGSILRPLLFLLYINDLPECLQKATPRLFADDTNFTVAGESIEEVELAMNNDLHCVHKWMLANKLSLNSSKTEFLLIGSNHRLKNLINQPNIKIDQDKIKQVHYSRLLGVQIDEKLTWNKHVEDVAKKATSGVGAIRRIRDFVDRETLISIYNALGRPHFEYCSEVWDTLGIGLSTRLQKLQNRAARIIVGMKNDTAALEAITALGWETLEFYRAKSKGVQMNKVLNDLAPNALVNLFMRKSDMTDHELRGSSTSLQMPLPRTENMKKSFSYDGAKLWNSLPADLRDSDSLQIFKNGIGAHNF